MGDVLFDKIESWQGSTPWGKFLDAGTGVHSLKWIQKLNTESWSAITADHGMKRNCESAGIHMRPVDKILVGNWMDDEFCATLGKFDTILADYLIGAVDGFSPYTQDLILRRLKECLTPNGKLYIVGMEPIPDIAPPPADIICEVRRARDACIQLAGHRPYREYPVGWIHRHLEQAQMRVLESKNFSILHGEESILRQVRVAQSKIELMNPAIRTGMQIYLQDLSSRVKSAVQSNGGGKISLSFDYVIAADSSSSVGLGVNIPISELNSTSL